LKQVKGQRHIVKVLTRLKLPKASAQEWPRFVKLIRRMRQSDKSWPSELHFVREWYEPLLHYNYDDAQIRQPDIAQLEQIASGYRSREQFLTEVALDPPDKTRDPSSNATKNSDYTILSTIHSAKAQEWRIVRILNVVDGCIPSDQADDIEEERRLLHVAMTRARNELDLIVPHRLFRYQQNKFDDRHAYGTVSRFIPSSIRGAFDCRTWQDRIEHPTKRARGARSSTDIPAKLSQMWR
jgi:DNA helicase II / ATP-dependent DNA helicase PcrA